MRVLSAHSCAPPAGFTVVELLIVVAILGVLAAVMLPASDPGHDRALDHAVTEVVNAHRFARSESMRTGTPHGVLVMPSMNRVQVFRVQTIVPPVPAFNVHHPVTRHLYTVELDELRGLGGISTALNVTWDGGCTFVAPAIAFDKHGVPHCLDPYTVLLQLGKIALSLGGETRMIVLDGETGRVTAP